MLVQHKHCPPLICATLLATVADNHSRHVSGYRQLALCHRRNILADPESALPPENLLFLTNAPLEFAHDPNPQHLQVTLRLLLRFSPPLLLLSASLSTHGLLHASKRRVAVLPAAGWGRGQKRRSVAGEGRLSMSRKTCGLLPRFILCKPKATNNIHQRRRRRIYGSLLEKLEVNW